MYERFEMCLKNKKLKASDVSKATGISTSTLSEWKSGKHKPSAKKMMIIAQFFGVSLDYLMGNTEIREVVYDYDNEPLLRAASRLAEKDSNAKQLLNKRIKEQINISDYEYNLIIAYRKANEGIKESIQKLLDLPVVEEKKA